MKSMTGYGRGECTMYERKFTVEIKAIDIMILQLNYQEQ